MKSKLSILALTMTLTTFSYAGMTANPEMISPPDRGAQLVQRVEKIKSMNFSELDKSERKSLRKELKSINEEAKGIKGLDKKVSVSVGAIIIAVLVLIIIL